MSPLILNGRITNEITLRQNRQINYSAYRLSSNNLAPWITTSLPFMTYLWKSFVGALIHQNKEINIKVRQLRAASYPALESFK